MSGEKIYSFADYIPGRKLPKTLASEFPLYMLKTHNDESTCPWCFLPFPYSETKLEHLEKCSRTYVLRRNYLKHCDKNNPKNKSYKECDHGEYNKLFYIEAVKFWNIPFFCPRCFRNEKNNKRVTTINVPPQLNPEEMAEHYKKHHKTHWKKTKCCGWCDILMFEINFYVLHGHDNYQNFYDIMNPDEKNRDDLKQKINTKEKKLPLKVDDFLKLRKEVKEHTDAEPKTFDEVISHVNYEQWMNVKDKIKPTAIQLTNNSVSSEKVIPVKKKFRMLEFKMTNYRDTILDALSYDYDHYYFFKV